MSSVLKKADKLNLSLSLSVIRAYSVSDFEKCATLLCYISLLC